MKIHRLLLTAAYLVMVSIAVFTVIDVTLAVWPLDPSQAAWRFGAVGTLTRHLISLLLALLLTVGVASVAGHRGVLRVCGALCAFLVLALLPVMLLFLLDTLQLRATLQPAVLHAFDLSAAAALFKMVAVMAVALVLGGSIWSEVHRPELQPAVLSERDMLIASSRR